MKKLIVLFILSVYLFSGVNNEILLIESKIYPKIMMLIKNLENKNIIKVAIVSNSDTVNTAEKLKELMKNPNLKIEIIKKLNLNYDAYVLTYPLKQTELNKLITNKKVIFSISPDYINKSMFSIYIGAKVYPYINPYLIKQSNLKINPIIFKVGKIYE